MEKFTLGLAIGGLGGALLIANSYKMRALVRKGQAEAQERVKKYIDEKLKQPKPTEANAEEKQDKKKKADK